MDKDVIDTFLSPEINYDFEEEPDDVTNYDVIEEKVEYTPPIYTINNGIALYSQLGQILAVYYHAKHGEQIDDVFANVLEMQHFLPTPEFHL